MKREMVLFPALIGGLLAISATPSTAMNFCADRAEMVKSLSDKFKENPAAVGAEIHRCGRGSRYRQQAADQRREQYQLAFHFDISCRRFGPEACPGRYDLGVAIRLQVKRMRTLPVPSRIRFPVASNVMERKRPGVFAPGRFWVSHQIALRRFPAPVHRRNDELGALLDAARATGAAER